MVLTAKTLSAPLRVYWALIPEGLGGLPSALAYDTASELASLKVFFVTLRFSSGARGDVPEIIGRLKKGGVRVTVSYMDAESFAGYEDISGADGLDIMPDGVNGLDGLLDIASGAPAGKTVSVSFVPARDNLGAAGEIIGRSLTAGIRAFNLPNPDVVTAGVDASRFVLGQPDREALKSVLEGLLVPFGKDVRLSVHDLFLHEALDLPGLGPVVEYAGCQAGDALAFIEGTGLVYPCSTWPEPLGKLGTCSFREVWSSEWRMVMRETVAGLPDECAGCGEAKRCKGGCAGLAFATGRYGGKDPGCGRQPGG